MSLEVFQWFVAENRAHSWNDLRNKLKEYNTFDINFSSQGRTLLMWMLAERDDTGASILLEQRVNDIDVRIEDSKGRTALDYAIDQHHVRILHLLFQNFGVDVNQANTSRELPLVQAINSFSRKSFEFLLGLGADLDAIADSTG
jgi:ankyrin repeat protein